MESLKNQSWIIPQLAEFVRTHWSNEDGSVTSYPVGKALFETYATAYVAAGLPTDPRGVDTWDKRMKRLLERAGAGSDKPFTRDVLKEILHAARIWVCGGDALCGFDRRRECPPPPPSWRNRKYRSLSDLLDLIPEAHEENARRVSMVINGYRGFVVIRHDSQLKAEQIQDQLTAREEEQDWIRAALETLEPGLARPEMIEPLHSSELSIMLADEAASESWARRIPALRESPAILNRVRKKQDAWAEKGYPELAVIGVLCWALAPLCQTWHVMNKKERTARVATLLKAADGLLADQAKARTQPELIPYFPSRPTPPLSAEEYERLFAEKERALLPDGSRMRLRKAHLIIDVQKEEVASPRG